MTAAVILLFILLLTMAFGWACLVTWAICFVAGLLGFSLAFSWKLVLAIWIISSIFSTRITVKK
jgi:hypothetical protein